MKKTLKTIALVLSLVALSYSLLGLHIGQGTLRLLFSVLSLLLFFSYFPIRNKKGKELKKFKKGLSKKKLFELSNLAEEFRNSGDEEKEEIVTKLINKKCK